MFYIEKLISKFERDGFWETLLAILRYPFFVSRRLAYQRMLKRASVSERFNEIYEKNLWGSSQSGSGKGSEIAYTEPLRADLINLILKYQVRKLVDAPCGDFNWMRFVLKEVDVEYCGFDIVSSVINKNQKKYGSDKVNFKALDICKDAVPSCDLLLVRDFLFHLSYEDINRFLLNIQSVEYKYLLTTTHTVAPWFTNKDVTTGDFRQINLFSKPFLFREEHIIERINDSPKGHLFSRQMFLVAKNHVPKSISNF